MRRALEDLAVVYLGSAVFKILRLTFIALFCVHLLACLFYRVKDSSAESPEDVVNFYTSRNIEEDVRIFMIQKHINEMFYTNSTHTATLSSEPDIRFLLQDLSNQYVRA